MSGSASVIPVAAAAISALLAYLLARYGRSVEMRSSEASTLWEESRQIREELRSDVEKLEAEIDQLRADRDRLASEVARLARENDELRGENARLHRLTDDLGLAIESLRTRIEKGGS